MKERGRTTPLFLVAGWHDLQFTWELPDYIKSGTSDIAVRVRNKYMEQCSVPCRARESGVVMEPYSHSRSSSTASDLILSCEEHIQQQLILSSRGPMFFTGGATASSLEQILLIQNLTLGLSLCKCDHFKNILYNRSGFLRLAGQDKVVYMATLMNELATQWGLADYTREQIERVKSLFSGDDTIEAVFGLRSRYGGSADESKGEGERDRATTKLGEIQTIFAQMPSILNVLVRSMLDVPVEPNAGASLLFNSVNIGAPSGDGSGAASALPSATTPAGPASGRPPFG